MCDASDAWLTERRPRCRRGNTTTSLMRAQSKMHRGRKLVKKARKNSRLIKGTKQKGKRVGQEM